MILTNLNDPHSAIAVFFCFGKRQVFCSAPDPTDAAMLMAWSMGSLGALCLMVSVDAGAGALDVIFAVADRDSRRLN